MVKQILYGTNKHKVGFLSLYKIKKKNRDFEIGKLYIEGMENLFTILKGICRANSAAGCN